MKMGEGWDGGVAATGIAPIPAFLCFRGKESDGDFEHKFR